MEEMKLIGGTAWIITMKGESVDVQLWQVVNTVLAFKEELSDHQLHLVKMAIDRETLHRSKLINSQTKVT